MPGARPWDRLTSKAVYTQLLVDSLPGLLNEQSLAADEELLFVCVHVS